MKKVLSLVLSVLMIAVVFGGCAQEYTVKVNKDGSCKITIFSAIPVETIEEMYAMENAASADTETEDVIDLETDDDLDVDDIADDDLLDYEGEDLETNDYDEEILEEDPMAEFKDMEIQKVNGKDCYVEETTEKFSSTKKANKYMLEGTEDNGSYFEKFKLTTKGFTATILEDMEDSAAIYGDDFVLTLNIKMPYIITKTNGTLSDNKKTVTFDLTKGGEIYAYTTKSSKSAKIYFKKDYLKSNSSAYLNWNKVKGAEKYKVQYKISSAKKWKSITTTKTKKTIKGLKAGKKYRFKVTAITDSKNYTSMKTSISTLKKIEAKVKSKTDKSIKLTWKKDKNADGYIVYKKEAKSQEWKKIKTIKDSSTKTYNVKKLEEEKKYYFKVVSYSEENGKKIKSKGKAFAAKTY